MPYRGGDTYELLGTVFTRITKEKTDGKFREIPDMVIGELIPFKISLGCTASKLSIPIPSSPAVRIRMGFQGPTLQIVAYLHTYDYYWSKAGYEQLKMCNWYDMWKNEVEVEDLLKVSTSTDTLRPEGYGDPIDLDGQELMDDHLPPAWSALPHLRPDTYWWVRKRNIIREAGWDDKFRLELDLERSWQWSTSGRPRPAYDVDEMACFMKGGKCVYEDLITEYKETA